MRIEFADVIKKAKKYDALDRKFKLVCNKGIQEVLHYITKFGLNNTEITEFQALNKIAERFPMSTDQIVKMLESTEALSKKQQFCAPHSCGSQIEIDALINKYVDRQGRTEQTEKEVRSHPYSKGFVRGAVSARMESIKDLEQLKSSLPTQPELVEVSKVTGVMINHFKREGFSLHESLNVHVNVPNILSLAYKEFREWLTADDYATKEDIFARAWLDGYTVKKEQLYYVSFGFDRFLVKGNAKFSDETNFIWIEELENIEQQEIELQRHFTEKEIKAIDERYWAFAIPVEEEE